MAQVVLLSTPLAQWPDAVVQLRLPHIQQEDGAEQLPSPPDDVICWVGYSSPLDCLERALQKPRFDDLAGVLERWRCAAESFLIQRRHHPDRFRLLNLPLLTPGALSLLLGSLESEFHGRDDSVLAHPVMRPELHPSALANLVISQRNDLVQLYAALEADADRFDRDPQSSLPIPACSDAALGTSLLQQWELLQHRSQLALRGSQGRASVETALLEEQDKELSRLRQRLERFEQQGLDVEERGQLHQENGRLRSLAEERLLALQASQSQLQQQTRRAVEVAAELQVALLEKDQVSLQLNERDLQLQDARQFIQHLQDSSQRLEAGLHQLGHQFEQLEADRRRSQEEAVGQAAADLEQVAAQRDQLEREASRQRALAQERLQELEAARAESEQFRRREEEAVAQMNGELERVGAHRDQLEQEADELRALAQERLQELEAARAESEQFRRREEEAVAQMNGELERVGAHRDQLEQEADELRALAQERLQELEAARSQAEEDHRCHLEVAELASAELEQVNARCQQLEHEAHQREQEMTVLRQSAVQLEYEQRTFEAQLAQLRREVEEGHQLRRSAETRVDDLQKEKERLDLQIRQLHEELAQVGQQLLNQQQEARQRQEELALALEEAEARIAASTLLSEEILIRVQSELDSVANQRDQLLAEAALFGAQNEELKQARLSAENRCEDVIEENKMLILQFSQLQDELQSSRDTLVTVQESARQGEIEMQELQKQQAGFSNEDFHQLRALAEERLHALQVIEGSFQESEQENELLQLQLRQIQEELAHIFQSLQQSQESASQREANIQELQQQRDELTRDLAGLAEECRHLFLHSSLQGDVDRSRIGRILQLVRESMQA